MRSVLYNGYPAQESKYKWQVLSITRAVRVILQFYSAVFFDNGCTVHQHFDVEFHNVQLLLQWRNGCLIP